MTKDFRIFTAMGHTLKVKAHLKMNSDWKHIKTIVDGDPFIINGLNIWDFDWKRTGQGIKVKDPLYGQVYTMPVFEISNKEIKVTFAAGEFSNCIWGIYRPQ